MSLRPNSVTPKSLALRRNNALKCTGPRRRRGKARVCLNALKNGRHAVLAARAPRLRLAIDRKMRFTVTLLKVLGLAKETKPTRRRGGHEKREIAGEARLPELESTLESE
jgi:hypothetical protein